MSWAPRKEPYTKAGIRRCKCIRCGGQAWAQWQICADGNNQRPLCKACDIELNEMVLAWVGHPKADALMQAYRERVRNG